MGERGSGDEEYSKEDRVAEEQQQEEGEGRTTRGGGEGMSTGRVDAGGRGESKGGWRGGKRWHSSHRNCTKNQNSHHRPGSTGSPVAASLRAHLSQSPIYKGIKEAQSQVD